MEILWEEEGFQFGFKRWQGWALSKVSWSVRIQRFKSLSGHDIIIIIVYVETAGCRPDRHIDFPAIQNVQAVLSSLTATQLKLSHNADIHAHTHTHTHTHKRCVWCATCACHYHRVPGEIKRREVELDPQVSPEEIMSREVELGCESWTSFASGCSSTAVAKWIN